LQKMKEAVADENLSSINELNAVYTQFLDISQQNMHYTKWALSIKVYAYHSFGWQSSIMRLSMKHWFEQTYDKLILSQLIFGDFRFVASLIIDIRASSRSTY
ncbi:hypothetical protein R0K04_22295, partial [Pseudoalteromonas sp. SIMBA_153]